jgi:hypothetical protein
MNFNIGDYISVNVEDKKLNGIIIDVKENYLVVIYVGKNNNGSAYAIMDDFDFNGNIFNS